MRSYGAHRVGGGCPNGGLESRSASERGTRASRSGGARQTGQLEIVTRSDFRLERLMRERSLGAPGGGRQRGLSLSYRRARPWRCRVSARPAWHGLGREGGCRGAAAPRRVAPWVSPDAPRRVRVAGYRFGSLEWTWRRTRRAARYGCVVPEQSAKRVLERVNMKNFVWARHCVLSCMVA